MQLKALLVAGLALATGATADTVITTTACPPIGACNSKGEWINKFGDHYWFNANTGCRNPGVPNIYEVCMDWKKGRAHFLANGQNKRCLQREKPDFDVMPCGASINRCSRQRWNEVSCTW
ncbi:hypothetical protein OPT61_g6418 [Boeremia exigua]|uniref:Uncharacterized protein n=1 Tax=Boeremia exigua TaxID=749465 RepID=A0ACC2I6P2_9PLEO|nr:hypothetical protein OPT61_g6418 [Boeremia exigua]